MVPTVSETQPTPTGALAVQGWGERPPRSLQAAIALASTALLLLEVSLTRLFSFTIWYHFAYLTISVALLGFGASGALVAAFPAPFRRHGSRLLVAATGLAGICTIAALVGLGSFPVDLADVTRNPMRFASSLLVYYVAVGLPFLLAGFAIAVPFAAYPQFMGRLYFWDLLGAAFGCVAAVALVGWLGVPGLIVAAAGLLVGASALLARSSGVRAASLALGLGAVGLLVFAEPLGGAVPLTVTASKKPAGFDDSDRPGFSKWTALNRVDAAGWDAPNRGTFWGRAGLKHGYRGPIPRVGAITYDGSNGSNIYPFSGSFDDFAMLQHHILRTPYVVLERPKVLVIGVGGGIDMMNAIAQGASHVTGAELQPETVKLLSERLRDFTGGFYDRPDVELLAGEGRHFVRKTDERFDLIQITAVDTFAAQATGAYILAESYLYTTDAMHDYFARLEDDGMVSLVVGDLTFPDTLPPLGSRLALIARTALEEAGAESPQDHLAVIGVPSRNGRSISQSILVKKRPFTDAELRRLRRFTRDNGFQMLYPPGRGPGPSPRLVQLLRADGPGLRSVLDDEFFRLDPVSDRDPFYYNVGKWANFTSVRGTFAIFPGSFVGQLVLVLMLVQATLLGGAAILLPLARGAREGLEAPGVVSYLAYFLALGVGFMFIEISFVQSFVLFLGSPTYALSVTIFSLLLFSSLGSLLSTRVADRPEWALRRLGPAIAVIVVVYAFGLPWFFEALLHLDLAVRIPIAVVAQLPIGLTLGMFMPLGVACVSREHPRLVPWAWGINGVGSVVGTTLAVILAMAWGFTSVALIAAGLYAGGIALMLRTQRTILPH